MLTNYFKIAFRNLIKNRSHALINISGLSIGCACALVIFLVIQYESGFDTHHEDSDRIYRVVRENTQFGETGHDTGVYYPMPEAIARDFSGIEHSTIVDANFGSTPVLKVDRTDGTQNKLKEENLAFTRPDYFKIFSYSWLQGDPDNSLSRPNTAVITRSLAEKLFQTEDAVGYTVTVQSGGEKMVVEITGIVKDPQQQTDLPFDIFISAESTTEEGQQRIEKDNWESSSSMVQAFVKLQTRSDPQVINEQLDELLEKNVGEERAQYTDFYLQPLSDIHYDTRFPNYGGRTVSKKSLAALGLIGLFLLITACINFINLNTAIAVKRSKEVGVRKVLGGTRTQLVRHFLGETAIVAAVSVALGIAATEVILDYLEPVLGYSLSLDGFNQPEVLLFAGGIFAIITLAAGLYPAFYLSGFNPLDAIRNRITASYGEGLMLRRGLVILQFAICQALIICTIIIGNQMNFARNFDMGFQKEAMVEVELPIQEKTTLNTFRQQLIGQASITNITYSNTGTANDNFWGGNYEIILDDEMFEGGAQMKLVDTSYVSTYGLKLLAGRNLTPSDTTNQYLVNREFAQSVGYDGRYQDLIGKYVTMWGTEAPLVGVVDNFNTGSLHQEVEPVLFSSWSLYFLAGIRINMEQSQQALAEIKRAYETAFPDYVFDYTFLDERIADFYEQEEKTANLMNGFTMIAILIGCLGLFGLVSYMATTRTKEIGVRKVLGASITDILKIFTLELMLLTGISFLIAAPVSWYLMQQWLADFAYQIDIGIEIFAMAFIGTLLIAALTVGYKSVSAALANPVNSLKSE